jgi:hypothetical protein
MTALQRRVFDRCDGRTLVADIASVLVVSPGSGISSEADLVAVVDELVSKSRPALLRA